MRRCSFCGGRIWPWQRRGWLVLSRTTLYWHPACRTTLRAIADRDDRDADE